MVAGIFDQIVFGTGNYLGKMFVLGVRGGPFGDKVLEELIKKGSVEAVPVSTDLANLGESRV